MHWSLQAKDYLSFLVSIAIYIKAILQVTGIVKSRSTSLLESDLNNSQILFNNASTAGFDNNRNIALINGY
jgi:hypothetical protein